MSTIPCKIIALSEHDGVWLIDRGPLVCTTPPHEVELASEVIKEKS